MVAVAAQLVSVSGGTASQLLLLQRNMAVAASAQVQSACGATAAWLLLLQRSYMSFGSAGGVLLESPEALGSFQASK